MKTTSPPRTPWCREKRSPKAQRPTIIRACTVTDEELKTQALYTRIPWAGISAASGLWSAELGRPVLQNVPEISWIPEDGTIATAADLEKIRNNPAGDYTLTADIQLDGTFTPLESFTGTLEGNGHTIKGLSLRDDETNQVAFLMENKGTIRNLGFSNVKIQGTTSDQNCFLAGIAVKNYGTIEQCYVNGKIYGGHRAGGITVHNYGTIRNCYTQVKINANWECGAIAAVAEDRKPDRLLLCYT